VALALAGHGYGVVVNYVNNAAAADEVVGQIRENGGQAVSVRANVALADDRSRLVDSSIREFGRLDVLVNNAGITSPGRKDLLEATEESWDEVFATNLKGPFFLAQLAAQRMIERGRDEPSTGGTIVNISSISAYAVSTNRADYCIAKSGMSMMTQLLATRLAELNIRVFEICPGVIASDMTEPVREKYDRLIAEGLSPMRRWGQPDDVARAVVAVVGDAFPFTTGQRIDVDGGYHIRRL